MTVRLDIAGRLAAAAAVELEAKALNEPERSEALARARELRKAAANGGKP